MKFRTLFLYSFLISSLVQQNLSAKESGFSDVKRYTKVDFTDLMNRKFITWSLQFGASDLTQPRATSTSHSETDKNMRCHDFYQTFDKKKIIKVGYFSGYADGHNEIVRDQFERKAFMAMLLSPCVTRSQVLCGFQVKAEKDVLFFKNFKLGQNEKTFEIYFNDSSISSNDWVNRDSLEQPLKSEATRQKFITSLKEDDVTVYSGHSRYGGGPDFFPEILRKDGEHDPQLYQSRKQGLMDMLSALDLRKTPASTIFMGSCDSIKHFHEPLSRHRYRPDKLILANEAVYETDFHETYLRWMHLLLTDSCPRDWNSYFGKFKVY